MQCHRVKYYQCTDLLLAEEIVGDTYIKYLESVLITLIGVWILM